MIVPVVDSMRESFECSRSEIGVNAPRGSRRGTAKLTTTSTLCLLMRPRAPTPAADNPEGRASRTHDNSTLNDPHECARPHRRGAQGSRVVAVERRRRRTPSRARAKSGRGIDSRNPPVSDPTPAPRRRRCCSACSSRCRRHFRRPGSASVTHPLRTHCPTAMDVATWRRCRSRSRSWQSGHRRYPGARSAPQLHNPDARARSRRS